MAIRMVIAGALLLMAPLAGANPTFAHDKHLPAAVSAELPAGKEITPACVALPLPAAPTGPSWPFEVNTAGSNAPPAIVRGTFWRKPCATPGDGQLLLTLRAISGVPFVCGGLRVALVQDQQQTNEVYLDTDPDNGIVDSFCSSLFVPVTVVLNETSSAFDFDDDASFTFVYLAGTSASPNAVVTVGAYDPAAYGEPVTPLPVSGKLSGSYFDPERNGEGVLVEVGQVAMRRVLFLTWYTYAGGLQRWIAGNVDFDAGDTHIEVPLIITTGGQFGAAFDPSQVVWSAWGSARISFPTCAAMRFEWSETGGQSGVYHYQRSLETLEGVPCP